MSTEDFMGQLHKWADQYEKACRDGVFGQNEQPHVPSQKTSTDSFFGLRQSNQTDGVSSVDGEYWNSVYNMSKSDPSYTPDDSLLQEGAQPEKYESLKDHPAVRRAESPNPIKPETLGVDQRRKVTPNWTDGKELVELDGLKRSLYELELKLSGPDGLLEDKNNTKVIKQLDALKKQIDELSEALAPRGWEDRES